MLGSIPISVFVGILLGFLAGLGVGGGSLLILWLTVVLGTDQSVARGINLLFFLPSALIAIAFRWKQGCLKGSISLPAIIAGCLSAAVFSFIGMKADLALLKKLFGGLLIITGLRELLYRS